MRNIKENSKTNCPKCGKKKTFKHSGWCWECTYPQTEETKGGNKFSNAE